MVISYPNSIFNNQRKFKYVLPIVKVSSISSDIMASTLKDDILHNNMFILSFIISQNPVRKKYIKTKITTQNQLHYRNTSHVLFCLFLSQTRFFKGFLLLFYYSCPNFPPSALLCPAHPLLPQSILTLLSMFVGPSYMFLDQSLLFLCFLFQPSSKFSKKKMMNGKE